MSNVNDMPNSIHACGDRTFGSRFGGLLDCHPVNLAGDGHHPHVEAKFQYGIKLMFDRQTALEFARALTDSADRLPLVVGDCSGALANIEETA